ncbi:DDE family transposase, partial [Rhodobacter sp. 140A]
AFRHVLISSFLETSRWQIVAYVTVRFSGGSSDPEMNWEAVPTGRRGRQQSFSDGAIQTCLSMKVLFGMALRQTTGFVESLLRLVGLDWTGPDFSTLPVVRRPWR